VRRSATRPATIVAVRHPMSLSAVALLCAVAALSGCGHCDGAVRRQKANLTEWCGKECPDITVERDAQTLAIKPNETFRLTADFRRERSSDVILAASGISDRTWFLVGPSGEPVSATITGDTGGHMCLNGAGFTLRPLAPLPEGEYALVLLLDDIRWPYLGDTPASEFRGKRAYIRRYRVVRSPRGSRSPG
jgi:hypothetical protein